MRLIETQKIVELKVTQFGSVWNQHWSNMEQTNKGCFNQTRLG